MPNSKTTSYILAAVKLIGILLKVSTGAGFCPVFPGMNRTHCGHMQSSLLSLCLSGPVIPCKCWICFKMLSTELGSATAAGVQHVLTQSPLKLVGSLGQVLSKKLTEEKHLLENLHDTRIFSLNQNSLFFINYIEFIYFPFMSVFFKLHPEASMRAGSIKSFWFKMIWFLMCIDLLFSCYDFANLIVQGSLCYLAKIPHFEPKHTLFQKYFPSAWFLNT